MSRVLPNASFPQSPTGRLLLFYLADDIGIKALLGGDLSLWPLQLHAAIYAAAIGGKIYLATDDTLDKTVGMALWWGECHPYSFSESV